MPNPIPSHARRASVHGSTPLYTGQRMTLHGHTNVPMSVGNNAESQLRLHRPSRFGGDLALTVVVNKADMEGIPDDPGPCVMVYHFDIPDSPDGNGEWEYRWVTSKPDEDSEVLAGTFEVEPLTS